MTEEIIELVGLVCVLTLAVLGIKVFAKGYMLVHNKLGKKSEPEKEKPL